MSVFAGPADWWTDGTDAGRTHIATKGIVQSGLILNLDAGVISSYAGTGTTWNDLSGNGNNGTLINGPTFSGVNNGVIVFDGINDTISLQNTISLTDFTISFFEYLLTGIDQSDGVVGLSGSGNDINHFAGRLRYFGPGDYIINSVTTLPNTWYHYAVSRSGTSYSIHTNGIVTASSTGQPTPTFNISNIARGNAGFLNGSIGLMTIYNRALTQQEIRQNFNATRGRFGI
jgi:hypothetical protein